MANTNGVVIRKKALKRLYPQGQRGKGPQRVRLTTTLPPEVMLQLREIVVVGKGGEAAPLVALSLELTTALLVLNDENAADVIPRLKAAGQKLRNICCDKKNLAFALDYVAGIADST